MLIQNAELGGTRVVDVRCDNGRVTRIGERLAASPGELCIDAAGGALLPGLHDHHLHLLALAAAESSVVCGPPRVTTMRQLAQVLRAQAGSGWIRGIAYHESVAGDIDRRVLDQLVADRPVRIQHRSGKLWMVNSAAAELLQIDRYRHLEGVECDATGVANGRLFRLDHWLRTMLPNEDAPTLARVSRQLASYGVTGITDATPSNSEHNASIYTRAVDSGQLLQRLLLMGDLALKKPDHPDVGLGACKILLDENRLPQLDSLTGLIRAAHDQQRPVAIHSVTRTELIFALSSLIAAGKFPGDRIEHASVTPDEALPLMQQAGVAVVTQFGFIRERGDQYLDDVEPEYQQLLYRGQSFLGAGVPLAGSSDAPYGSHDPWFVMRAAVERTTASGRRVAAKEVLSPEQALALFTTDPRKPGSGTLVVEQGVVADFCLLDRPWISARGRLDCADVLATVRGGELIYERPA
ncbi:amidohydrolase family protein [Pseudohalioglobus lutimaris]|uniref:Hydrolase n=1 Tax=Pseudohalioglobus lutimaris TaxID=1737061 RepID=A0A2N5X3Z3_9GAMM|nr:amidohydrolase family protein [Pseudohalioglobus lutimaris]PLW69180.1 hydrolase [Pseudohalioglobus lutimaris]